MAVIFFNLFLAGCSHLTERIFLRAVFRTSRSSDFNIEYSTFSGSSAKALYLRFLKATLWIFFSLLFHPLDHVENVGLLIVKFAVSFNLKPANYIHLHNVLHSMSRSSRGRAPLVHKHINLIAKVNHLAWFSGPIFQAASLGLTLPFEMPRTYFKSGL